MPPRVIGNNPFRRRIFPEQKMILSYRRMPQKARRIIVRKDTRGRRTKRQPRFLFNWDGVPSAAAAAVVVAAAVIIAATVVVAASAAVIGQHKDQNDEQDPIVVVSKEHGVNLLSHLPLPYYAKAQKR